MAEAQQPNQATPADHGAILQSWHFPEYPSYQRGRRWYLIAIVIGAGLIIWSVATSNFLFGIIIVMTGVIFVTQSRRNAHNVVVQITEDGIVMGQSFYRYADIKNFWIVYEPPHIKKLYLSFKEPLRPLLAILLENENPVNVRRTLRRFLDEDLNEDTEPSSDSISRLLKI